MRRALALALALVACNLAPGYERPKSPVSNQFPGGGGGGLAAADRGWRGVFGDARLQRLIGLALENNRDLRVAVLNVQVAQATYRIEGSALYPQLGATANGQVAGTENGIASGFGAGGFTQYRIGLSASWELDLFGRIRNLKEAALQDYFATVEARRAAHISLVGEVVTQYLRERAFEEQRQIAERTVELVSESVGLTRRLFEAGQRSELDVKTAEAQLHAARSEVIRLTRVRQQAENALALLVGQELPRDLPEAQPLASQAIVADLPSGVPSEVLLRRPDVLAAEHALQAANANIGVARAAFFPSISLTGFLGKASQTLSGLVSRGIVWNVAPTLAQPLFTAGRNKATLEVAKLRTQIEVARYERAIQVAFREVADALIARSTLDAQLVEQTARVEAELRRYELSDQRYKNGIEPFLAVIEAQQDLYVTQVQLIELRLQRLQNLADLYAALGGGWKET